MSTAILGQRMNLKQQNCFIDALCERLAQAIYEAPLYRQVHILTNKAESCMSTSGEISLSPLEPSAKPYQQVTKPKYHQQSEQSL